jgi:hypothetical protein
LGNDEVVVGIELTDLKAEIPVKNNECSVTAIKKFHPVKNHSNAAHAIISSNLNYQYKNPQHQGFGINKESI